MLFFLDRRQIHRKPSTAIKARAKVDIEPITMPFRKCDVLLLLMGETPDDERGSECGSTAGNPRVPRQALWMGKPHSSRFPTKELLLNVPRTPTFGISPEKKLVDRLRKRR
uniref:Uncharacterized protein n=1 Tax=Arundo donax TaxID=35708 RepID=A0A0A9ELS4_ARUDO